MIDESTPTWKHFAGSFNTYTAGSEIEIFSTDDNEENDCYIAGISYSPCGECPECFNNNDGYNYSIDACENTECGSAIEEPIPEEPETEPPGSATLIPNETIHSVIINVDCNDGFYYNNGACPPCNVDIKCHTCENGNSCTSCPSGYVLSIT